MIRDLTPDDKDIFFSLMKRFYASNAVTYSIGQNNFEATFETVISKSQFIRALILEDGGAPAGYALLSFTYSNEAGGLVIFIEELYVIEKCRGRGLGTEILRFIEREYPSAKRLRLEVRADNKKAIHLYKKLGFNYLDYAQMYKDIQII